MTDPIVTIQQGRSTWQGPQSAIPPHLLAAGGRKGAGRTAGTPEGAEAVSGALRASDGLIDRMERICQHASASRDMLIHDCALGHVTMGDLADLCAAARARIEAPSALPGEVVAALLAIGKVEWGGTVAQSDAMHASDFERSLSLTREHFQTEGPQALQGVYLTGTETVLCHTGTSPNSGRHASIIVGAWNWLHEVASRQAGGAA